MQKVISILSCFLVCSCAVHKIPETEFRGVWVATVVNIDWPKHADDVTSKKKEDFLQILDFYEQLNFNAAVVQIRTAGDAFYKTDLAPWSKYLSGKEGKSPEDFENPLEWMIGETHKRGMEFHAWLNPYRATFDLDTLALDTSHDFYQHPDWMVKYGKKYYYNPGLPEVQQKFVDIVEELVTNYPVDAIHFDDYFYPYKVEGEFFDDDDTFRIHALPNQALEDWRRSNVDSLVKSVHLAIKKNKPWVQFGISPFGVWKNKSTDPKGSDTKAGQTTYEDLYADPLLWIKKGWLDYLAPQAYWSMDYPPASHRNVVSWWANNSQNTNLYIGNGPYKIRNNKDRAWKRKNEIPKQLSFSRELTNVKGNIFFSAKSLIGQHEDVTKKLQKKFYRYPSKNPSPLSPVQRIISQPKIDSIIKTKGAVQINISHRDSIPRFVNFYSVDKSNRKKHLLERGYLEESQNVINTGLKLQKKHLKNGIGISINDAYGNESDIVPIKLKTN
ncbi:family 10 glycosylhydrolase [Muricauda sp. JGD-17]|uniref:Family 10 glycosylhydrolase n=1 Tax=Flagellimonas ochracea TaxID=2696472 RepID=A0A964T935_9FLAO|nr:family 10 glycosylhydrolase [Allomuricauda ochracea]NAY90507.1 family 10 glycosylhydrolase [Allomuricauda ochracea]